MSVPKQCDAKDHLSVARNKSRSLHRRALADKASPFKIASERPPAEKSNFAEDFIMEHSLPGLQITSNEMVGSF
jgi:hypothetical protein